MKRIIATLLLGCMVFSLTGCSAFETLDGLTKDKPFAYSDVNDLESGKAYVWHDDKASDIKEDLKRASDYDVFFSCITGDINFKGDELSDTSQYPRSIWMDSDMDDKIPTVTRKDKLLYVSDTLVPDAIVFERFADYGYTIGVSNMVADEGDHYYIPYAEMDEDDYKYYIDMKSDASQLAAFNTITKLYLDKVDDTRVNRENVSAGGTVLGLTRGKSYVFEFYTGTYYQDFKLRATIHSFGSFETFTSYKYEFLHSNCIAITIPDYFVSGYYFINGVGLFRYVAEGDEESYNKKAYDENVNWNEPMILYDEFGTVIYNPSDPDIEETDNHEGSDVGKEDYEYTEKEEGLDGEGK